ncbi:MAG: hypothetical protein CMF70_12360 [Magnetovibrio sp.]|nr:hypothetical protein [Magnetovibrio sp.]
MLETTQNEYNYLSIPAVSFPTTPKQGQARRPHSHVIQVAGYAISFEELVQRFGARIDNGFNEPAKFSDSISAPQTDRENDQQGFIYRDVSSERHDSREDDPNRNSHPDHEFSVAHDNSRNGHSTNGGKDKNPALETQDSVEQGQTDNHEKSRNSGDSNSAASTSGEKTAESNGNETSFNTLDSGAIKNSTSEGKGLESNPLLNEKSEITSQNLIGTEAAGTLAAALYGYNKSLGQHDKFYDISNSSEPLSLTSRNSGRTPTNTLTHAAQQKETGQLTSSAQQPTDATNYQLRQSENIQRQAMQLSQVIGGDSRLKVDVSVSSENTSFASRPMSTMSNASIFTSENSNNNQTSQPGQHQPNNNMALAVQAQTMGQQNNLNQGLMRQSLAQGAIQSRGDGATGGTINQLMNSGLGNQQSSDSAASSNQQLSASNQQAQQTSASRIGTQENLNQGHRFASQAQNIAEQVSVKIQKALQAGNDRINIQLKPAELGKVDVKMELTHDGRVQAVVTAESKDTLDLLRRDASELQRALQDAGLKTETGDLSFNLKGKQESEVAEERKKNSHFPDVDESKKDADANDELQDDGIMAAWEAGIITNNRVDVRI